MNPLEEAVLDRYEADLKAAYKRIEELEEELRKERQKSKEDEDAIL